MRTGSGSGMGAATKRTGAVLLVAASSIVVAGCVAPLLVAGLSGAGMFGATKGMSALQRRQMGSDDQLRSVTAGRLGISADDITAISDKHWRHGVVHWVATNRSGQRFSCEWGTANGTCAPFAS